MDLPPGHLVAVRLPGEQFEHTPRCRAAREGDSERAAVGPPCGGPANELLCSAAGKLLYIVEDAQSVPGLTHVSHDLPEAMKRP